MGVNEIKTKPLSLQGKRIINVSRTIALLSIVSAHCAVANTEAVDIIRFTVSFLQGFGSLGVSLFFFISGMLFARNKKSFLVFWKGKVKTLFIPWFSCSILVYLYVALRKNTFNVKDFVLSVIGYSSSFWFCLTLTTVFLIMFLVPKNKVSYIILIALSLVYRIPLWLGVFPKNNFFNYVNPLNWLWIFCLGILCTNVICVFDCLDDKKREKCIFCLSSAVSLCSGLMLFFILLFNAKNLVYYSYSSFFNVLISVVFVLFAICLSSVCVISNHDRLLLFVGERSFSVYLLHELGFAGGITHICSMIDSHFFVIVRPFLVIGLCLGAIEVGRWVSGKIKLSAIYEVVIGSRLPKCGEKK